MGFSVNDIIIYHLAFNVGINENIFLRSPEFVSNFHIYTFDVILRKYHEVEVILLIFFTIISTIKSLGAMSILL